MLRELHFRGMMARARLRPSCALIALVAAVFSTTHAAAQTKDIEPTYMAVTGDHVMLLCCHWSFGYPVGELGKGDLVLADGRIDNLYRVGYPSDVAALVKAEDVEFDEQRGVVRLIRESRLRAHDISDTSPESWKSLLSQAMQIGAELDVLAPIAGDDGRITGYLVRAPEQARGYVDQQFLRLATPDEVAPALVSKPAQVTQALDAAKEQQADSSTIDETKAEAEPVNTIAATSEQGQSASDQSHTATAGQDQSSISRNTGAPSSTKNAARPVLTRQRLDAAYKAIIAEPIETAEIEPLIDEHQKLLASTPDTELNASLRAYLKGRIELLKIRLDLRQDLEKLADLERSAEQGARRIDARVAALGQRREYVAVGRLTTSSLYDGQRLPRMYRLQSVDGDAGRTVAYLLPNPDVDLNGKLGSIVGVQGAREPDANIRMIVLRPVRVDVLTSADDRNDSD